MMKRTISVRENKGRPVRKERTRRPRREGLSERPEGCRTIFVGNLPWETEEEELRNLFGPYGDIVNARIVKQSWTKRSRGFGYVEFQQEEAVTDVIATAVKKPFSMNDRELRLDYADQLSNE